MPSILILEDQYTKHIYEWLHSKFPNYTFPLTESIQDPMQYKDMFDKVDLILLDNYFPWVSWWREEPLWCEVLEYLLAHDIHQKVVCISDYRKALLGKYDIRSNAYNAGLIHWFPSKDIEEIASLIPEVI
jgi:hypothetical protein